ncbi:MAG: phosphomannomutase [Deltaproteobacteria bacterium]|nr:phosphomannomutase [Deltaproteobacteria bacterium]
MVQYDESGLLPYFKAYDIRGKVPEELNEEVMYLIGRGFASEIRPDEPVAVGRDIRLSSLDLCHALMRGLNDSGVNTKNIGVCGTELIYFAASRPGIGGGLMVTASHNPKDYNGVKMVRANAVPISGETELPAIERRVREKDFLVSALRGGSEEWCVTKEYVESILRFVPHDVLKSYKVVANAGNGCAGPILDALAEHLPFSFVRLFHDPDGGFPNGIPNPLLPENRAVTAEAVRNHKAHLGLAWDGDFDRCFFFDEQGTFIEGYYVVGLLAERMLESCRSARIVHDTRLIWNTIDLVRNMGGVPVQSRTGHAFMKARMREVDAAYGGEMSAHHYFRDFGYCDSGMIPWILVALVMSRTGKSLSELVGDRMRMFPCSGEVNRVVQDPDAAIGAVRSHFEAEEPDVETLDGVSMAFGDRWRFNLRKSNTEPILRLNVESRGDPNLVVEKTREILSLIEMADGET